MTEHPDARRCTRLFYGWLCCRTALWTALAAFTLPNAPLDLIEWLAWGREWQWGYPKHPPLPAWVAEAFVHLSPGGVWGVYLAGYLAAASVLWSVWRLAREMLPPRHALLAALCLDGLIYLVYDPAAFSNNIVLDACWAAAITCAYLAARTGKYRWWVGLGVAFGCGLLTKYTIALLLPPLLAFALWDREARRRLLSPGPLVAAAIAAGLFAPHVVWLTQHDFITVHYAQQRSLDRPTWVKHFTNPLFFALSQWVRLLPVLIVLLPLTSWLWRPRREFTPEQRRDRDFLAFLVAGPVLMLLAASLLTGYQIREIWGSPLWACTGVAALVAMRVDLSPETFRRARRNWAAVVLLFVLYTLGKNAFEPALKAAGRSQFPGKPLAEEVSRRWAAACDRPFPVVAGEAWIAGNIGCYAPHRPSLYSSGATGYLVFDEKTTPWASDALVKDRGGVIVWDADQLGSEVPHLVRLRFPEAVGQPVLEMAPICLVGKHPPVRVGLAFVLPRGRDSVAQR